MCHYIHLYLCLNLTQYITIKALATPVMTNSFKTFRNIYIIVSLLLFSQTLFAQTDTTQHIVPNRKNSLSQQQKPYVILISADGFRYDYDTKYQAKFLLSMERKGVYAPAMIPSFPSLTFPNHYTLVTGMYPSHHGIVDNSFYDPHRGQRYTMSDRKAVTDGSWYGGTPLWVLAEQQQMLSASLYWVGSEALIKGVLPTYWYRYNEKISIENRIQIALNWLKLPEEGRPHFITFYLPEVDHEGHLYGPDSEETRRSVLFVDSAIQKLTEAVRTTGLPVNFIFVSDHGMTRVNDKEPLRISAIPSDTSKYSISGSGTMVSIRVKHQADIPGVYNKLKSSAKGYKVYLSDQTPAYWHYAASDNPDGRIADILLIPEWPGYFSDHDKINPGAHGYDPVVVKDMLATFIAWGPAFRARQKVKTFQNIHIYPLITQILGLTYDEKIDGSPKVLQGILKKD